MTDIELRAKSFANYIIENRATVRATAKYFGTSKSTVHKDVSERLLKFSPSLAKEAKKILDYNKAERHFRCNIIVTEKRGLM